MGALCEPRSASMGWTCVYFFTLFALIYGIRTWIMPALDPDTSQFLMLLTAAIMGVIGCAIFVVVYAGFNLAHLARRKIFDA